MNREYWKLFWTTGMPEAWLMSRDGEAMPPSGAAQGGGAGAAPRRALGGAGWGKAPRPSFFDRRGRCFGKQLVNIRRPEAFFMIERFVSSTFQSYLYK